MPRRSTFPRPGRARSVRRGPGRLALLGAFAAVACNSGGGPGGGNSVVLPEAEMNMAPGLSPEEAAQVRGRVETALGAALTDPILRYANVRQGVREAICGEVETSAAGGAGTGLRPFIVTPGGEAVISATPALRLEEPSDPFPDLYMEYCASAEELRAIAERMEGMTPPPPPPVEHPAPGAPPVAAPEPSEPRAADAPPPPPRRPRPRPPGDDSFFNAVVRPNNAVAP